MSSVDPVQSQSDSRITVTGDSVADKTTAPTIGQHMKRGRSLDDLTDIDEIIDQVASGFTSVVGKKSRRLEKAKTKSSLNSTKVGNSSAHYSSQSSSHSINVKVNKLNQESQVDGTHQGVETGSHANGDVSFGSADSIIDLLNKVKPVSTVAIATQTDLTFHQSAFDYSNRNSLTSCSGDTGADNPSTRDCSIIQSIEKSLIDTMCPLSNDITSLQNQLLSLTGCVEGLSGEIDKLTSQKSSPHVNIEGVTSLMTIISTNVKGLNSELTELQETVLRLSAQQGELLGLRDAANQTSSDLHEIRSAVMSGHQNDAHELCEVQRLLVMNQNEIKELRDVVKQSTIQRNEMKTLQDTMKLLSSQVASLPYSTSNSDQQSASNAQCSTQSATTLKTSSGTDKTSYTDSRQLEFPPLPHVTNHQTTYSNTLQHNRPMQQPSTTKSTQSCRSTEQSINEQLKQDVMAAMYVDLKSKQRRSNNVILSGLQQSETPDRTSVCRLLHSEFQWKTSELEEAIVSCRRIGRAQQDKIQPVLIIMNCTESAAYFIANAKKLRQSRDSVVREKIFISEDMTPAEAKAAFEIRRQRREQQSSYRNQNIRNENHLQPQRSQPEVTSRLIYRTHRVDEMPLVANAASMSESMIIDIPATPLIQEVSVPASSSSSSSSTATTSKFPSHVPSPSAEVSQTAGRHH